MPINPCLKKKNGVKAKVILLGSGALSIGQAGEFDYSGSQALKALEEEGVEAIVINPNIASVQTNKGKNKKVYLYPVTPFWVEKVIKKEKPQAIMASFGGQTALNCVIALHDSGVLAKYDVEVLGSSVESLKAGEDRDLFSEAMHAINMPVAPSVAVETVEKALSVAKEIGYPVIIRSAYSLGGLGSGFADNEEQLKEMAGSALSSVPQILVEKSVRGWKEIEYEVMRDSSGNVITICNMENLDPMGIHTGDSIVIAPTQTLNVQECQMLREGCIRIVNALNVVGECNVQYALDPVSMEFYVIEINVRLSRSSALASKATGYPIAYIAAKVCMGFNLLELKNPLTGTTSAYFEPSLDYISLKVPRWDLKKFSGASKLLGTQMKSVGEVMAIGKNFCEAMQKAMRMVYENEEGLTQDIAAGATEEEIWAELDHPTNLRPFALYELFRRGHDIEKIKEASKIEKWFLDHFSYMASLERELKEFFSTIKIEDPQPSDVYKMFKEHVDASYLLRLKTRGFSDFQLTKFFLSAVNKDKKFSPRKIQSYSNELRKLRKELGIVPVVKKIDTTSAEYHTESNYLYLTYSGTQTDLVLKPGVKSVITLGSGCYRIGSSIEFDWCSVMSSTYFKKKDLDSVIINCNPETVSTDYNTSDRLYFEEVSYERVMDIIDLENPLGAICSMGGQNPNNLIEPLFEQGVHIMGHSAQTVQLAEDRNRFSAMLDKLGIDQPKWVSAASMDEVNNFVKEVGFPILIRPSFVLSGTLMNVASDQKSLEYYLSLTKDISDEYPVVLSQFIMDAKEIECDGVAKNGEVIFSVVSEHVENAGVHSGDATLVAPAEKIYLKTSNVVKEIVRKIARELNLNGPFNIQFIAKDNEVKVIECNARASRSFPFVSKIYDINMAELACKVMNNEPVKKVLIDESEIPWVGVKASMFSFQRLDGADPVLGVEMVSTGEAGCLATNFGDAMLLAMEATNIKRPKKGVLLSTGREWDKIRFMDVVPSLFNLGLPVYTTPGTAKYLEERGFKTDMVNWYEDPKAVDLIMSGKVDFVINIHKSLDLDELKHNAEIRKRAIRSGCTLLTNLEKTMSFIKALDHQEEFLASDELISY
ncbi:carbamoyl-phosphate synthase large subunit [Elusimicrobium posterum]|uniref:carbamoyl-phosphate synthase (glutamine-hydrolyzing) large subunit n=1 Tax=Elusimicrobium posterum TaxID=3116653 RepID=UPI003C76FECD